MRPGNLVAVAGLGVGAGVAAAGYWGVAAAVRWPGRRLLDGRLVLCSVRTDQPVLALTFDDGGLPPGWDSAGEFTSRRTW